MEEEQQQGEPNSHMDHLQQPDPLLKHGAFIDPNPTPSNGASANLKSFSTVDPPPPSDQEMNGTPKREPSSTVDPKVDESKPSDQKSEAPASQRPDWLPPGWIFHERVRASGASAGSRDKYYVEPKSQHRFRSKKEVLYFLETGSTKKKKNADSDADSTPAAETPAKPPAKRKKSGPKVKNALKNFNFDNVPTKVKWELSDIYEGTWRPLINGADRVPESAKQEWTAAFTYLTLQNDGGNAQILF